jgi:hypothetical protein
MEDKMRIINVHGGMSPEDLLVEINVIVAKVNGRRVVVLLDEVNSMRCVWTIKELICEGLILGRRIPNNLRFICIMNPRRRRTTALEATGLDFSPYQLNTNVEQNEGLLPLIYEVHRAPEAVMSLVWDFGLPSKNIVRREDALQLIHGRNSFPRNWQNISDEILFAENMIHWMIVAKLSEFNVGVAIDVDDINESGGFLRDFQRCERANGDGAQHYRYLRNLLCGIIQVSQEFLRNSVFQEISASSLRDIARTVSLIPFIITVQQRSVSIDPVAAKNERFLYFHFLSVAIQVCCLFDILLFYIV